MRRVAVLASGRGSNLAALIAAAPTFSSYRVTLVISNKEGAGALSLAAEAGLMALCIPSRGRERGEHERQVLEALESNSAEVLCLAGYMRVLSADFIRAFAKPILNIHPSLLPAFQGMHAQRQAIEAGVRVSGATVHFVDAGLDTGPIVLQEAIPVEPSDNESTLSERILGVEHRLFPRAVDIVARDAYRIDTGIVRLR